MAAPADSFRRMLSLRDKEGNTNLHHLAADGKLYLLLDNLNNGVKLNDRNNVGATPLHLALSGGHFDVVCFLIRHGADADARPRDATASPLVAALEKTLDVRFAQVLMSARYRLSSARPSERLIIVDEADQGDLDSAFKTRASLALMSRLRTATRSGRWMTLKNETRHAVRRHLSARVTRGRSIVPAVERLPIPTLLKKFLLFEVNEDFVINFDLMMRNYMENKAFGWEKMLMEIETSPTHRFSSSRDLIVEEICDRPFKEIDSATKRRTVKLIADSADPSLVLEEEEEEELVEMLLRS